MRRLIEANGRDTESAIEASIRPQGYDDSIELATMVPVMSELGNGHLGELLASFGLPHADKDRHAVVLVVNNTRSAAIAHRFTNQYALAEIPRAINENLTRFKQILNCSINPYYPEAIEVAKKIAILPAQELKDWLMEERTIYEENQLTIQLVEIINQAQQMIEDLGLSAEARQLAFGGGVAQMHAAWQALYPKSELPFGFVVALKRGVKIKVVDLSSEQSALESRNIGQARQIGVNTARSLYPNLKVTHSRDADTLSHDAWWQFLWENWAEISTKILTIPQLSRIKEPEVISSSIKQSIASIMVDQCLNYFDRRLWKYLQISTSRLGGSQLMVPQEIYAKNTYPDADMNEDFVFASQLFRDQGSRAMINPVIWPELMILLYNRSRPASYDGRHHQSNHWFTGERTGRDALMNQANYLNNWQDHFADNYSRLASHEMTHGPISILAGKTLEEWYFDTAKRTIKLISLEQQRIIMTVKRVARAIVLSYEQNGRVDEDTAKLLLSSKNRSIIEANPKIYSFLIERVNEKKLFTQAAIMAELNFLFGDLLEVVSPDTSPVEPSEVSSIELDRTEFKLNEFVYIPVLAAMMEGIWAWIERQGKLSTAFNHDH